MYKSNQESSHAQCAHSIVFIRIIKCLFNWQKAITSYHYSIVDYSTFNPIIRFIEWEQSVYKKKWTSKITTLGWDTTHTHTQTRDNIFVFFPQIGNGNEQLLLLLPIYLRKLNEYGWIECVCVVFFFFVRHFGDQSASTGLLHHSRAQIYAAVWHRINKTINKSHTNHDRFSLCVVLLYL